MRAESFPREEKREMKKEMARPIHPVFTKRGGNEFS